MQLGFGIPISGAWATPDNQLRLVRRAEELGYHSLWTFQRLLVPEPPDERAAAPAYRSVLDAIVPLAFVAGHTSRIRLGLSVVNIPFFAPATLTKQLTTLDVLSRGRLDVGLGIGWSRQEYAAVGVPYQRRGARAEEFIAALRALWTREVVEFHGDFYQIPRSRVEPKPVQRPHPPLYQVCVTKDGIENTALRGWPMLNSVLFGPVSQLVGNRDTYVETLKKSGRAPAEDRKSVV